MLRADFRRIDLRGARVILIEGSPKILGNLAPDLSTSAQRQLEQLGVHVRVKTKVKNIKAGEVELESGETIRAANIIWAAGVAATPLTKKLGVELDRAGRVKVNSDLSVPGHPDVFAIGDMALVLGEDGKPVPGVSPAAMQMARHVVRIIKAEIDSTKAQPRPPFRYWDKGSMATIGRSAAVAEVGSIHLSGLIAWLAWLVIHLVFLVGFLQQDRRAFPVVLFLCHLQARRAGSSSPPRSNFFLGSQRQMDADPCGRNDCVNLCSSVL